MFPCLPTTSALLLLSLGVLGAGMDLHRDAEWFEEFVETLAWAGDRGSRARDITEGGILTDGHLPPVLHRWFLGDPSESDHDVERRLTITAAALGRSCDKSATKTTHGREDSLPRMEGLMVLAMKFRRMPTASDPVHTGSDEEKRYVWRQITYTVAFITRRFSYVVGCRQCREALLVALDT